MPCQPNGPAQLPTAIAHSKPPLRHQSLRHHRSELARETRVRPSEPWAAPARLHSPQALDGRPSPGVGRPGHDGARSSTMQPSPAITRGGPGQTARRNPTPGRQFFGPLRPEAVARYAAVDHRVRLVTQGTGAASLICLVGCIAEHRDAPSAQLFPSICQHWGSQMLRSVLSAIALAGVLAIAQPAFADPLAATASDHAQAAPAAETPSPRATAQSSSDATPVAVGHVKDVPVGFGWG
jgi:hypothetical protein